MGFTLGAKVENLYQYKVTAEPSKHQRTKKWNQRGRFCSWFQSCKSISVQCYRGTKMEAKNQKTAKPGSIITDIIPLFQWKKSLQVNEIKS